MTLADFRDLIIVIWGILGIIFLIAIAILAFFLYSKVSSILGDAKTIMYKVKTISNYASREVVEPLIGLSVLVHSVAEGAQQAQRVFFGRRGNGSGGRSNG